ncbi:hypothetical protein Daus18300_014128 [Diaporthe australafricana]|uniref:Rhodopsin domain-containing protein n=1 Tax=Diaporthe australafricana TaxID=127596 RepID=A0ABR3VWH1_9PEZI
MEYLTPAEIEYQLKLTIINLPIAFTVTALGRIAIGVTILRIVGNTSPRKRWAIWAMLVLVVTASIVDIFLGLFRCGAPQIQWDLARLATAKCISGTAFNKFNFFTIAVQTFSDYFFSVLPMMIVWKLHMEMRQKLTIMFLLSLTLVTGAVGTARLAYMIQMSTADLTGRVFEVAVLFSFEAMFIIVFGSIPVLNPLWELCVDVKQSRKRSRQASWSKESALGSSNKQSIVQGTNVKTPLQDVNRPPASNMELARPTGYPEEPAVSVYGGDEITSYPQQSACLSPAIS